MQSKSFRTTGLTVWRGPQAFYALAAGQTISQIGSNMAFLAVGIYVYQQTGQATPLAMLSLLLILLRIVTGGVAGVLADRYDRRALIIIGDSGAALGSLTLAISLGSGHFQVWHVYAAALWQALFSALQRPSFEASVSQLVPDAQRQRANAVLQMSGSGALLFSSALAGLLYVTVGVVGIFLIDLISFLLAVVAALLVSIPTPPRTGKETQAQESMLTEWRAGVNFLWSRRPLLLLILLVALFNFFISSVFALMTPYVLSRTGSEPMLGVLNATLSIGGLVGALLIGAWGGFRRRIDTIILAMVLVSVAIVFFGTKQSLAVMGAALFFAMLGVAVANATAMTLLQSKIPGDMQGRVFAIFTQLTLLLMPWGYLLVGPLADQVFTPWANSTAWREGPIGIQFGVGTAGGMGGLFAISAALALLATLLAYASPSVRRLDAMLTTYDGATERTLAD